MIALGGGVACSSLPAAQEGVLVDELADAGRGDAEGLDVDGALLVDGQHVLQRVHLLAHRRPREAALAAGVLAAASCGRRRRW